MKKLITVALSLMFVVCLSYTVIAGSLEPSGPPTAGSGMYTLQNLYDYLTSGTALTVQTSFQEPTTGPGSTMKSTKEIGDTLKSLYEQCPATDDNVESGVKFFCTQPGSWGVRTGTLVALPRPTATPTQTQTPTQTPTPTMTPTATWACGSTFTDVRDSKVYTTVKVGTQCWMKQDLEYDSGCTSIPWTGGDVGACGYYSGGPFPNEGLLYQYSASLNVCPSGWRLPTDADHCTLEQGLDGTPCECERSESWQCAGAAEKMLATDAGGNNSSGLSMRFTGYRNGSDGSSQDRFNQLYFRNAEGLHDRIIISVMIGTGIHRYGVGHPGQAFAIRCIKN